MPVVLLVVFNAPYLFASRLFGSLTVRNCLGRVRSRWVSCNSVCFAGGGTMTQNPFLSALLFADRHSHRPSFPGGTRHWWRLAVALLLLALTMRGAKADVQYATTQDWGTGFNGQITITNPGAQALSGWSLEFDWDRALASVWDAVVVSHVGSHYVLKSAGWNDTIAAGGSASFGFGGTPGSVTAGPRNFLLNGTPVGGSPSPPPAASGVSATITQTGAWSNGFSANLDVVNGSAQALNGWTLKFSVYARPRVPVERHGFCFYAGQHGHGAERDVERRDRARRQSDARLHRIRRTGREQRGQRHAERHGLPAQYRAGRRRNGAGRRRRFRQHRDRGRRGRSRDRAANHDSAGRRHVSPEFEQRQRGHVHRAFQQPCRRGRSDRERHNAASARRGCGAGRTAF